MEQKGCASVYTLTLSGSKQVVLRGFGIFFGDDDKGGVFLERYTFCPQFTEQSRLTVGPWSCEHLPTMVPPNSEQSARCRLILMELTQWIIEYEVRVHQQLGADYRRESLAKWDNGKRWFVAAERMSCLWRHVQLMVAANAFESAEHESARHSHDD